jgi:hypothetical protein
MQASFILTLDLPDSDLLLAAQEITDAVETVFDVVECKPFPRTDLGNPSPTPPDVSGN